MAPARPPRPAGVTGACSVATSRTSSGSTSRSGGAALTTRPPPPSAGPAHEPTDAATPRAAGSTINWPSTGSEHTSSPPAQARVVTALEGPTGSLEDGPRGGDSSPGPRRRPRGRGSPLVEPGVRERVREHDAPGAQALVVPVGLDRSCRAGPRTPSSSSSRASTRRRRRASSPGSSPVTPTWTRKSGRLAASRSERPPHPLARDHLGASSTRQPRCCRAGARCCR